jgi:hypothetical protein
MKSVIVLHHDSGLNQSICLKSYLPEVKTSKTEENVSNDMAPAQDSGEAQEEKAPFSTRKVLKNDESKRIVEDEQSIKRQSSRTVIMEVGSFSKDFELVVNQMGLNIARFGFK